MIGKYYLKRVGGYDPTGKAKHKKMGAQTKKPLFKRTGKISEEEREHLSRIGALGGRSRSSAKLGAVKKNLKKAMAKRFPGSPKWKHS